MRIGLVTDIHSNLLALEAALKAIKKHNPDRILSLGDQINLGPCPRETLQLLKAEEVTCLHGNHERYVLSVLDGDPAYQGANFNSLRFNAQLLSAEEITFPEQLSLDGVTFCHAFPGNDRFPIYKPDQAIPLLRAMHFEKETHIICGHGHNPTHYTLHNLSIDSIGATGCMDEGVPGSAGYSILEIDNGETSLRPFYAPYDPAPLHALFKKSGMADFCPTMAHLICLQMMHNHDFLVAFITEATQLAKARGEEHISKETWLKTDRTFSWPDGIGTAEFWR